MTGMKSHSDDRSLDWKKHGKKSIVELILDQKSPKVEIKAESPKVEVTQYEENFEGGNDMGKKCQ